jgi:hypothetical protein
MHLLGRVNSHYTNSPSLVHSPCNVWSARHIRIGLIQDELIQCWAVIPVSAAFVADKDPPAKNSCLFQQEVRDKAHEVAPHLTDTWRLKHFIVLTSRGLAGNGSDR